MRSEKIYLKILRADFQGKRNIQSQRNAFGRILPENVCGFANECKRSQVVCITRASLMADSLSWLEYHLLTDLHDLKRATLSLLRMCLSRKRSNGEMAISDLNARWSCRRGSVLISRLHDLRGRTIHDRFGCIDWLLARQAAVHPCALRELSNSYWRTGYVRSTALVNLSDDFRGGWMRCTGGHQ